MRVMKEKHLCINITALNGDCKSSLLIFSSYKAHESRKSLSFIKNPLENNYVELSKTRLLPFLAYHTNKIPKLIHFHLRPNECKTKTYKAHLNSSKTKPEHEKNECTQMKILVEIELI